MRIHFNKPSDWKTAYLHYWNAGHLLQRSKWPGITMSPDSDDCWYTADIPLQDKDSCWASMVFHDGAAHQTRDLSCRLLEAWFINQSFWDHNPDIYKWFVFPNGSPKAVVLSFDDGSKQDKLLISLFSFFHLKGTFHINSGLTHYDGKIPLETLAGVYQDHEVSAHSLTHPYLDGIEDIEALRFEVESDRLNLQDVCGYPVRGLAYPFGVYNHQLIRHLPEWGFIYARTTHDSHDFMSPANLLKWHPTCHHHMSLDFSHRFLSSEACQLQVFFVWGHSWELDGDSGGYNWHDMYDLCETLAARPVFWSAGAAEVAAYIGAIKRVEIDENGLPTFNPADNITVYLKVGDEVQAVQPGDSIKVFSPSTK
jgi:hypothetical protein